jgi:hypothetical protein
MNDSKEDIFFTPSKSPKKEPKTELFMDINYERDIIQQPSTRGC